MPGIDRDLLRSFDRGDGSHGGADKAMQTNAGHQDAGEPTGIGVPSGARAGAARRCWTGGSFDTVLVGRLDDVPALDARRRAILRALTGEDRE